MARIISDETYARLVKHLAQNETVALFQQLVLAEKAADDNTPENDKKKKGADNELQQSNA